MIAAGRKPWTAWVAALVLAGTQAQALSDADKCEAAKLKRAGQYAACRLKAEATAVKKAALPDYSKCDTKFGDKWASAEAQGGGMCPTSGDAASIQSQVTADVSFLALKLSGTRFVDNGDATVTDTQTGLIWEKKDSLDSSTDFGNPHDVDNDYDWSGSGTAPDGSAFIDFLGNLNNCVTDGITTTGGFAGHCDWRLPTISELEMIADLTAPGCGSGDPCIDPAFGPTLPQSYWSSTTDSLDSAKAAAVFFAQGGMVTHNKVDPYWVRAVSGGP